MHIILNTVVVGTMGVALFIELEVAPLLIDSFVVAIVAFGLYEASQLVGRTTSQVDDRDLFPEVDPTIIHAFLKEPSEKQRSEVQAYIDRQSRRERGEEAAMLERLSA
jgi:hypothetical protein